MAKGAIHTVDIHFKASQDLKDRCEQALISEGKWFSEFFRDAMFQKVREHEHSK